MESMSALTALPERRQSVGEEIANSVSHGVGLIAGALAAPVLIFAAVRRGDTAFIVGASIFAATIVLMYLSSTLYHALPENRAKRVFRVLDHGARCAPLRSTSTRRSSPPAPSRAAPGASV